MSTIYGDMNTSTYKFLQISCEQTRAAALVCADSAKDADDLRVLLSTMGMAEFCRFCGSIAVVRVALNKGCACYPDDREQWLCDQHWYKVEPIGRCDVLQEGLMLDEAFYSEI